MRVNIYGVGRSGTKALHLWTAYVLAQEFGVVWLGYEPFRYRHRRLTLSDSGWQLHRRMPLLISQDTAVPSDSPRFWRDLSNHPVGVAKFIRANGRINLINSIMQPDLSVLVVRDLYEVLASIAVRTWGLVENDYEWGRICGEAQDIYPFLKEEGCLRPTTDKLLRSAVHWFTMNKYALDNLEGTAVMEYSHLQRISALLEGLGIQSPAPPISDPIFRGDNIHKDYPLQDLPLPEASDHTANRGAHRILVWISRLVDRWAPAHPRTTAVHPVFPEVRHESVGTLCTLNTSPCRDMGGAAPTTPVARVTVERNSLLDEMSSRVRSSLNQALQREEASSNQSRARAREAQ